ncbi:MAG TPA: protein kinase, partial [Pirellulales bacterium]|nr:protein kinase [Pirellulales bacterium]
MQSGKLSRYQAKVLMAGKPGPFVYGDYVVYDRAERPRLAGLFRARHLPTKHPVCLLFLAGSALNDPQAIARLVPQVALARQAGQSQPRVSACHQFVDLGKFKFLVVEDLQGNSLDERLKNSTARLSIAAACRLVRLVAQGLAALHSMGQAHGHVRPENIWLDEAGAAKLLQFPLVADPLAAKVPPFTIDAQLDYLAPELAAPGALAEPPSDVYSLGCVLFTLLVGQPPFAGGDRANKLRRHAKEAVTPIVRLNPQVPTTLGQVLTYLLQKEPAKRYADAAAVAESLQPYSGTEPQVTPQATLSAYLAWLDQEERGQLSGAAQPTALSLRPAVALAVNPNGAMATPVLAQGTAQRAAVRAIPIATQPAVYPAAVATAVQPVAAATFPGPVSPPVVAPAQAVPASGLSTVAKRRTTKRGQTAATFGVVAGAAAMLLGFVWFLQSQNEDDKPQPLTQEATVATHTTETNADPSTETAESESQPLDVHVAEQGSAKEPIQGIGQPIWQSPTDGEPLNLAWLPPGVQVVLALRPAEMTQQKEWEKLSDKRTFGTVSQWLTDDLPKTTGKTLDHLDTVLVGLLDGSPGPPKVALVARANEEFKLDDLHSGWGDANPEEIEGQVIHLQSGRAFYLPASGDGKLLVVAPLAELREMVKSGGQPPALRREMEVLAETSDDQRQLTLLVAPNFPLTDGKGLFIDEGAKLLQPLRMFLEWQDSDGKLDLPKAAMLSCHLGDHLFVELRLYDNFGKPAQSAAREFQRRVAQLPKQVSGYVRDLALSGYSKPILWDYKDQLDVLSKFTRLGVEGKQIVLRAYLPAMAAHNLVMGA